MPGQRSRETGTTSSRRASPAKNSGTTIVEIMVVAVIATMIISLLCLGLGIGQISFPISSAKAELQAKSRILLDQIAKDIRQAPTWDIANNNPGPSYIRFRRVVGFNTNTAQYILENDNIEYIYDANNRTITRNVITPAGVVTQARQFGDITAAPFFTRDAGGAVVALNEPDLRNANAMIITITSQKTVTTGHNVFNGLSTEVKIRNE